MKLLEMNEKREELFNAIIRNAMDALIVIDAHGVVHAWNPKATRIFGWHQEEALGKPLYALIAPDNMRMSAADEDNAQQYWRTADLLVLNERTLMSVRDKAGRPLRIEATVTPLALEGRVLYCASIRNPVSANVHENTQEKSWTELPADSSRDQRMIDHLPDVICTIDTGGQFTLVSAASERIWGYRPEELLHRRYLEFTHPDDRSKHSAALRKVRQTGPGYSIDSRFIRKDGSIVHIAWSANWSRAEQHFYCVARDNTEIRNAALTLIEHEQRFESLFEHHPDGVFAFDLNGHLLSANKAFSQLTGYSGSELAAMPFRPMVAPESVDLIEQHFAAAVKGSASSLDVIGIRKDGSSFDAHLTVVPIIVNDRVVGVHGIARDVTHSKDYERRIEHLATYDALTGLPNRNLLDDRIRHAIVQAERQGGRVGVLFLDLNRFKIVNDSLGHDKGDILLRIMADRLKQCVREVDTVARIGGDEFVIVLEDVRSPEDVIGIARNLLAVIENPVALEGHDFTVSSSIGCSLFPKDGTDAATLLRNADLAMYEAKASGGGSFRFYKADMNERVKARLMHERQLRLALERGELVVYYQPRVDINSNEIVGAEALVRWHHPERGLVPPNEFIPLAEEVGLINELGEWVLHTACKQNRRWQEAGLPGLKVSVNLSPYQLAPDSTITHAVRKSLMQSGLDARWLELEITESSLMQNVESTLSKLAEIRDAGVSISIDDFGTGYSSLSYLRRLPVDTLKIDQSFIRDISGSRDDAAIVSATIALAHTMQLKVVAEGVTTEEQIRFLEEHDCDEMQGFLLSPAVPPEELSTLLNRNRSMSGRPLS
ncbi:EAL and GGDEF domain-containing protein [Noviherbaspirillum saxi]|uniref:EAL domain-containing protein n=1 Tax=Noviherbaspirillum saxi TaxID=2320863 RepID=A0A3A3FSU9_9BURK|nr:EAL domain-containing protein [Noviherbaspirillum saxi]RJF99126.1 EAL domain-containing protein [Noviherbaspirillum saxi]